VNARLYVETHIFDTAGSVFLSGFIIQHCDALIIA